MWCHLTPEVFSSLSVPFFRFLDYFSFTCHTRRCKTNFPLKVLDERVDYSNFLWGSSKIWTWNIWPIAQSWRIEFLNPFNGFIVWTCIANNVNEPKDSRLDNQNEKKKQRDCKMLHQQGLRFKSFTSFHQPKTDQSRQICMETCIAHI